MIASPCLPQLLRSLLHAYGGHEVRADGDSLTAAFHDAVDAVQWAVAAQEALLAHPWPARLLEHPYCAPVHLVRVSGVHPCVCGWKGSGSMR